MILTLDSNNSVSPRSCLRAEVPLLGRFSPALQRWLDLEVPKGHPQLWPGQQNGLASLRGRLPGRWRQLEEILVGSTLVVRKV